MKHLMNGVAIAAALAIAAPVWAQSGAPMTPSSRAPAAASTAAPGADGNQSTQQTHDPPQDGAPWQGPDGDFRQHGEPAQRAGIVPRWRGRPQPDGAWHARWRLWTAFADARYPRRRSALSEFAPAAVALICKNRCKRLSQGGLDAPLSIPNDR